VNVIFLSAVPFLEWRLFFAGRQFCAISSIFDRFIKNQSNQKNVPEKTTEISFVNHIVRLLKPERLASGIFGNLVFSFF